jgi:hypothetical protein
MELRKDILDELMELSPVVAGIEKRNVFSVPDSYFDNLNETLLACISEEGNSVINNFSKDGFFEVPQDYFENLSTSILDKIKAQQPGNAIDEVEVSLSPALLSIQHKNVFKVPAGYFNGLAADILNKVTPAKAKVISIRTSIFKYAAAAIVTGIMALGVYKFTNHSNHGAIASLDPTIEKGIKMNDAQFDQTLNSLSEDDISNYLQKNVSDGDVAELSSDIDDNSLPSQDQYLSDSKTLDNYLNSSDTKETNN